MSVPEREPGADARAETAATNATAAGAGATGEVAGLDLSGGAEGSRSGEDGRRRGWFWHWNSVVTQYAPLLGLKGVGLLNSYTVWTDRREESPHRGYAFPSQQSEADFYGEDRAELITINKILVALDLIEIRKEMVLRRDEQGRRWRVPHNFYRVKDHADGFTLSTKDVLRVAELADRDKAVYRYVRRVFSPRFAPIDADNPWHRVLPVVQQTEVWQRLTARAAAEENRASARTRAGHAARRSASTAEPGETGAPAVAETAGADFFVPSAGDTATISDTPIDSDHDSAEKGGEPNVALFNKGSDPDVAPANKALKGTPTTSVDRINRAEATVVAPANTTYDQSVLTTTTSTEHAQNDDQTHESDTLSAAPAPPASTNSDTTRDSTAVTEPVIPPAAAVTPNGFDGRAAPSDAPGELAAIEAFEAANNRRATPAERVLLRQLAERFDAVARASASDGGGWGWLATAVYEAVDAGSAFVAPRRLREIMTRWERDGFPAGESDRDGSERRPAAPVPPSSGRTSTARPAARGRVASGLAPAGIDPTALLAAGADLPLPHGHGARRTWALAVQRLGTALDRAVLRELVAGTAIAAYDDGEVTIAVPTAEQAARLAVYRDLIGRKLGEAMRRPLRIEFAVTEREAPEPIPARTAPEGDAPGPVPASAAPERPAPPVVVGGTTEAPNFPVVECGLASGQVWAAVMAEIERGGRLSRANLDAWVRSTRLLGRAGDGGAGTALIVGAPNESTRRRVIQRFAPELRAAIAAIVGVALPVEFVVTGEWLTTSHPADAAPEATRRRA